MPSGLPNKDKAAARQLFAEKKIDEKEMLKVESASYHSPGTCTFYGTANSNQLLMEAMGVQLSGASFEQPKSEMRPALTASAVEAAIASTLNSGDYRPLYEVVTEKSLVNSVICLLATGGSTNHCLHLVAIANAAGIDLTWEDIDELSDNIPLLARIYPNGYADVNHFHKAGGIAFLIRELRSAGLLNEDVINIMGKGLDSYTQAPHLQEDGTLEWKNVRETSGDLEVLTTVDKPFSKTGGLKLLKGNLGKACTKISAVAEEHHVVEAPAHIFHTQDELIDAFNAGELFKDMIALVRFQGPKANGMPELHKLTPLLGIIQDKGFKVAIVTDGRMSGASGKVPSAIHVSPEACSGGMIAKVQNGDIVSLNAKTGELQLRVSDEELSKRPFAQATEFPQTLGRTLFATLRNNVSDSEHGAQIF
jgi:phosphogluconate dehydratase